MFLGITLKRRAFYSIMTLRDVILKIDYEGFPLLASHHDLKSNLINFYFPVR